MDHGVVGLSGLLHLVELVPLPNQALHLPQHPVDPVVFFRDLEDLLVLEVVEAIADAGTKLLGDFALPLLPL